MLITAATDMTLQLNIVLNEFLRSDSASYFWTNATPALFMSTVTCQFLFSLGVSMGFRDGLTVESPVLLGDDFFGGYDTGIIWHV